MEAIYPISALQKDAAAVRRDAEEGIVRLTVDGRGKYVFATEDVLEDYVQRRVDDRLYEQAVLESLARAEADIEAGRVRPAAESFAALRAERAAHVAA